MSLTRIAEDRCSYIHDIEVLEDMKARAANAIFIGVRASLRLVVQYPAVY